MAEKSISDKIVHTIDVLSQNMQTIPDLQNDILPFMEGTFFKIKQMSFAESDYETSYELMQIANNYLPRVIYTYCELPIEYRNSKKMQNGQTAREMLVSDLQIIRKQVEEIESAIYSKQEKAMRVNSTIIKQKFEGQMQLATQVQNDNQGRFVNQFNIEEFLQHNKESSYIFKKQPEDAVQAQTIVKQPGIMDLTSKWLLKKGFPKAKEHTIAAYRFTASKMPRKNTINNLITDSFAPVAGLSAIVFFLFGLFTAATYESHYSVLKDVSGKMYQLQAATNMNYQQLTTMTGSMNEIMSKKNDVEGENTKIAVINNGVRINSVNIDNEDCEKMVDHKVQNMLAADMYINSIPVKDTVTSQRYLEETDNHKLCYLKDNNKVEIVLSEPKIYNAHNIPMEESALKNKLDRVEQVFTSLKTQHENAQVASTQNVIGEELKRVKKIKTTLETKKVLPY